MKTTSFIKKYFFNKISREYDIRFIVFHVVVINEYRSSYIDIKNVIAFAFLKIKKVYNSRH